MSSRIYTYKITFEEVFYYYYGVHKEKRYDEYYMGTPVTHKWVWDFYTPKKQILEVFPYSDDGWDEAQEVEKRIIKEFYNQDKWCLNENVGGFISLKVCRENGKKSGKIGGRRCYELGVGAHGRTKEQKSEHARKIGNRAYELGTGIHSLTPEQRSENGKKGSAITSEKYSKEFALISPNGEIVKGRNVNEFCRKNNLNSGHMSRVLQGTLPHHKGWRKYIPDNITILDFL